jgi:hypothetical protein
MGQEVNPNYTIGIIFEVYEDGTMRKIIRWQEVLILSQGCLL